MADGLLLLVQEPQVGVLPARLAVERLAPLPENFFQFFSLHPRQLAHRAHAQVGQGFLRHLADAGDAPHRQRRQESRLGAGGNPQQAARLGQVGGHLGHHAALRHADGAWQLRFLPDGALDFLRRRPGSSVQTLGAGQVEVGFVNRDHVNHRGEALEDSAHALRPLLVQLVVAGKEDGVRAEFLRRARGHGGVDAEGARFVAGRRHHPALVARRAHHHRLAAQLRPVEQLHRHVERVHVHMCVLLKGLWGHSSLPLGGEDAGDAAQVVGDFDVRPGVA